MDIDFDNDMSDLEVEAFILHTEREIKNTEMKIKNYRIYLRDYKEYLRKLKKLPKGELIRGLHALRFPPNSINYGVH
jgi:hypothetical protein